MLSTVSAFSVSHYSTSHLDVVLIEHRSVLATILFELMGCTCDFVHVGRSEVHKAAKASALANVPSRVKKPERNLSNRYITKS